MRRLFPRDRRSGQAIVELALSLPIILLIFVIAVDFGRIYQLDISLRDAAFAGARHAGMVPNDNTAIKNAAVVAGPTGLTAANVAVSGTIPRASGQQVTVTVTYQFSPATPLISTMLPGGAMTLNRSASDIIK